MDQSLHNPEIWSILFHKIPYVIYNGLHVANLIKMSCKNIHKIYASIGGLTDDCCKIKRINKIKKYIIF